jgi:hypothetical protein
MQINFKISLLLMLLAFPLVSLAQTAPGQVQLIVDRYGKNRERYTVGDEIYFKVKEDPARYRDYIVAIGDSTLTFEHAQVTLKFEDLEAIYVQRKGAQFVSKSSNFVSGGFLFAAAVHPLVSNAQYSASESAVIGASFFTLAQAMRLFFWKKYKFEKRARIRSLDLRGKPLQGVEN